MEKPEKSLDEEKIKKLDSIFILLLAVQVIFGISAYFFSTNNLIPQSVASASTGKIIVLIVNSLSIFFVVLFYRSRTKSRLNRSLRVNAYLRILRYVFAIILITNIINLAAYILTGITIIILVYLLLIGFFYSYRPSVERFEKDFRNQESL